MLVNFWFSTGFEAVCLHSEQDSRNKFQETVQNGMKKIKDSSNEDIIKGFEGENSELDEFLPPLVLHV